MLHTLIERLAEQFPNSRWSQLWRQILAQEALRNKYGANSCAFLKVWDVPELLLIWQPWAITKKPSD